MDAERRSPSPNPMRRKLNANTSLRSLQPKVLYRVAMEGNIGAGKSSLVARLDLTWLPSAPLKRVVQEPVELWEKSGFLERMYNGDLDVAQFQVYALATRTQALIKAIDSLGQDAAKQEALGEQVPAALVLVERDMEGDCCLFARHYLSAQQLVDYQKIHAVHCELVRSALARWNFKAEDHVIAVRVSPEIAAMRVTKRDRLAEKNLSLKTLIQLDKLHAEYFSATTSPVWEINANNTPDAMYAGAVDILKNITRSNDDAAQLGSA